MNVYLLRPIDEDSVGSPWEPWYDKVFGFVIRAESEEAARRIADANMGDEKFDGSDKHPWLSSALATCVILSSEGAEEMIMRDRRDA